MKDRWIKKYRRIQPFRRFVLFLTGSVKLVADKIATLLRLKSHTPQPQKSAPRYSKVKKTAKKVHYHVAKKPHEKLLSNSRSYYWWHTWEYKRLHLGLHG